MFVCVLVSLFIVDDILFHKMIAVNNIGILHSLSLSLSLSKEYHSVSFENILERSSLAFALKKTSECFGL